MTKPNPHAICGTTPVSGYYPGDFAIECPECRIDLCRHMIDFPAKNFQASAALAKADAIETWNKLNPKGD